MTAAQGKQILIGLCLLALLVLFLFGYDTEESSKGEGVESLKITGAVGNVHGILQVPELRQGEKCPLVVLMHGITSSTKDPLMTALAEALQHAGIASIRFDFNGHGESDGTFQDMTVPKEIEDARNMYTYARSLPFVSDIALLGHSQGGVVASMLGGELGTESVAALVLMAPAAVLKEHALQGNIVGVRFDPEAIPEYVTIFNGYKLGREYIKAAQALPIYEVAGRYAGPVFIIHGLSDTIVDAVYGERYQNIYENATLALLDGEDHVFSREREKTVNSVLAFLREKLR